MAGLVGQSSETWGYKKKEREREASVNEQHRGNEKRKEEIMGSKGNG